MKLLSNVYKAYRCYLEKDIDIDIYKDKIVYWYGNDFSKDTVSFRGDYKNQGWTIFIEPEIDLRTDQLIFPEKSICVLLTKNIKKKNFTSIFYKNIGLLMRNFDQFPYVIVDEQTSAECRAAFENIRTLRDKSTSLASATEFFLDNIISFSDVLIIILLSLIIKKLIKWFYSRRPRSYNVGTPVRIIIRPPAQSISDISSRSEIESKSCPICMENFNEGENIRLLHCGHYFHFNCINNWLMNYGNTCPYCREPVPYLY